MELELHVSSFKWHSKYSQAEVVQFSAQGKTIGSNSENLAIVSA